MGKNIMFVDDEEDIRFVVKMMLEQQGYIVTTTPDGNFLQHIDDYQRPDIFLLDRDIKGTDGLLICMKLKSNPDTKDIPVIMLSADPYIKSLYKVAGADGYIEKPFEQKDLINKVSAYIH